ncbi:hypothetical protein BDC45DRAFT_577020 [Circinella umbellata]|nr:hypothetical protein BDC45DRAFT_577020 [Circinella umbellata]
MSGRNEHMQRRKQLLVGIRTINNTLPFIPPIQRAQLEAVIFSQQQEVLAIPQRILELEASIAQNHLQHQLQHTSIRPTINITKTTERQEINNTPQLLPTTCKRRRRTKIPMFSNGDASIAQHWLEKYSHICEYLQFTPDDQLMELSIALEGPAIKWFSTL